jgi:hypothetical protein
MTINHDLKNHQAVNTYQHPQEPDEISLFELLDAILSEKHILIGFIIASIALSPVFIFIFQAEEKNLFEVEYSINYPSMSSASACKGVSGYNEKESISNYSRCLNNEVIKDLVRLTKASGVSLQSNSTKLYKSIADNSQEQEIISILNKSNSELATLYSTEAHSELEILKNKFSDSANKSDFISDRLFSSHKLITTYDLNKKLPIEFSNPSIKPKQQKTTLILSLSVALGFMTGVLVILTRRALLNYRKSKSVKDRSRS